MKIHLLNDPILRLPTQLVTRDELGLINSLIPEMTELMTSAGGVAIAANQVGVLKRFFLVKIGEDIRLMINPVILHLGQMNTFIEGCLSIPGTDAETQRAETLRLQYVDENFDTKEEDFVGLNAVAIQHEVDHLDGKLYVDSLPPVRKMVVLKKHKKHMSGRR